MTAADNDAWCSTLIQDDASHGVNDGAGCRAERISLMWDTHEGQWRFESRNEVVTISEADLEADIFCDLEFGDADAFVICRRTQSIEHFGCFKGKERGLPGDDVLISRIYKLK